MSIVSPGRFAGLVALLLLTGSALACGSAKAVDSGPTPPPGERVQLHSSTSTRHYNVRGATSETIFDYIARNGPTDDYGQRGFGLTLVKWRYESERVKSKDGCRISGLTITLELTVTLPKHDSPQSLSPPVLRNWERFVAEVTAHEQRHVDIYMSGAMTMKQSMEAIQPQSSCDLLEGQIDAVWKDQQKATEAAQDNFHRDEDNRLTSARKPVLSQIESNRARISSLNSQIRTLDQQIESLRKDLKSAEDQIAPVEAQMQSLEAGYGRDMPPSIASRYEGLRTQYRTLVARYNSLVNEHNAAVERRDRLGSERDQLISTTNDLVETYNWIR